MHKFTKSLLFLAGLVSASSLMSCSGKEQLLSPEDIIFSKGVLYWKPVYNAESYRLQIDSNEPIDVTGSAYLGIKTTKDFSISLVAVDKDGIYKDSNPTKMKFHFTSTPKNFRQEDGILKWNKVEECENYELFDLVTRETYNVIGTSFADYNPTKTNHEFVLKVSSDNKGNIESDVTDSVKFKTIEAPQISYNYDESGLVWTDKDESKGYELSIQDEVHEIKDLNKLYKYIPEDESEVKVKIRAISKVEGKTSSAYSRPITLKRLDPISKENINIFNSFEGQVSFRIKEKPAFTSTLKVILNDVKYDYLGDSFELPLKEKLNNADVICVPNKEANTKTYFRLESRPTNLKFTKLAKIQNITLSENKEYIEFDGIEEAKQYLVHTNDGQVFKINENKFLTSLLKPGFSEVTIKAISDNEDTFDGDEITFTYSKSLTPSKLTLIESCLLDVPKVEFTKVIFNINNKDIEVNEQRLNLSDFAEKVLKVKAKYKNTRKADIILDGEYTETYSLEKLPDPTNLKIENSILTFEAPKGDKIGYDVFYGNNYSYHFYQYPIDLTKIEIPENSNLGLAVVNYFTSFDLKNKDETYFISSNIVNYSSNINQLLAPTITSFNGRRINFTKIDGASGYKVTLNGHEEEIKDNFYLMNNELVKQGENRLRIIALSSDPSIINSSELSYNFKGEELEDIKKAKQIISYEKTIKFIFDEAPFNTKYYVTDENNKVIQVLEGNVYETTKREDATYKIHFFLATSYNQYFKSYKNVEDYWTLVNTPKLNYEVTSNGSLRFSWNSAPLVKNYSFKYKEYLKKDNSLVREDAIFFDKSNLVFNSNFNTSKYYYEISFQALNKETGKKDYHGVNAKYVIGRDK